MKRQRLYLGCISNSIDATLTKRLLLTLLSMLLLLLMLKLMLTSGESMLHNSRSVAKATITTTTTINIHLNIDLTCLLDPLDATSPNPIQQCGFNCRRNVADITMNELLVWPMMMATAWLAIRRLSSKLPLNRDWYHRSLTNFGASSTYFHPSPVYHFSQSLSSSLSPLINEDHSLTKKQETEQNYNDININLPFILLI